VFEVGRSIRRFRKDPAWQFRWRPPADWAVDRRGFPFTLGDAHPRFQDWASGTVAGYPTTLAHFYVLPIGSAETAHSEYLSLAVLELPFVLPDTAVTPRRLAHAWRTDLTYPYAPEAGRVDPLPGGGRNTEVRRVSTDHAFGAALLTDDVLRRTVAADCGWRLSHGHLIGWTDKRRTYEHLVAMAEQLAGIVAAFPPAAQAWARPVDRRG
jgi:hypothetical protein